MKPLPPEFLDPNYYNPSQSTIPLLQSAAMKLFRFGAFALAMLSIVYGLMFAG